MRALQVFILLCLVFNVVNIGAVPLGSITGPDTAPSSPANSNSVIDAAPSTANSTCSIALINDNREPVVDSAFGIPIHPTCQGNQALQVERALNELHRLVISATNELLQSPTSEINQMYWGPPNKSDLSTPIGVFHQLLYGSKKGVKIRCEDQAKQCKEDKVLQAGGYADKDSGAVHLCSDIFSGNKQRRFIEDICNNDWTLADNQPHQYWSAVLLNLFLQSKQVTSNNLMSSAAWAYPNVLNVARLDPIASAHNIDTYLYFVLDHFAQQHINGGCRGVLHANLVKDKKAGPVM